MRRLIAVGSVALLLCGGASALAGPIVPGASVETYATLDNPRVLCFDDDGFLYVGNGDDSGKIRRIPPGGGSVEPFGPDLWDPDPVGFDRTGKISGTPGSILTGGTSPAGSYIGAIHPDESFEYLFGPGGVDFFNPSDMAFDATGTLFFADPTRGVYRTAGDDPTVHIRPEDLPDLPHFLAIDGQDNIFVSTVDGPTTGSITKFAPDGSGGELIATGFDHSIAIGNGGMWGNDLYSIRRWGNNHDLIRIHLDGSDLQEVVGTGFGTIPGNGYFLTFGADRALYVADRLKGKVLRIAPEPSTLILLMTGSLALLAYGRRKRRGH